MPASPERIAAAQRFIDAYNSMSPEEQKKVHESTTQSRLLRRHRKLVPAKKPDEPKKPDSFDDYIGSIEEKMREEALRKKKQREAAKREAMKKRGKGWEGMPKTRQRPPKKSHYGHL